DVFAIGKHLFDGRSAKTAAMVALCPVADRVVIAVKEKPECVVKRMIPGNIFFEGHLLKKPGGMCDVPLGRRDIDYGLRYVVLDLERNAKRFRGCSNIRVKMAQVCLNALFRTDALHGLIK